MVDKPVILTFSGKIKSGKTTLSKSIAKKLDWSYISFGDYIRSVAKMKGLIESRETLQNLGEQLVETMGWERFCKDILDQISWKNGQSIVIDGVRHSEAILTLKKLTAPSNVLLVYLTLDENDQKERLSQIMDINNEEFLRMNSHSTEIQVYNLLPNIADLILDGSQHIDILIDKLIDWLKNL